VVDAEASGDIADAVGQRAFASEVESDDSRLTNTVATGVRRSHAILDERRPRSRERTRLSWREAAHGDEVTRDNRKRPVTLVATDASITSLREMA